jgi:hypothetical protein
VLNIKIFLIFLVDFSRTFGGYIKLIDFFEEKFIIHLIRFNKN